MNHKGKNLKSGIKLLEFTENMTIFVRGISLAELNHQKLHT